MKQVLMNKERKKFEKDNHEALFRVQSSIRYHNRLCHFYGILNACAIIAMAAGALVATSYLVTRTLSTWTLASITTVTSITGILNLTLGWQHKAKKHEELKQRFTKAEALFSKGTLNQEELTKVRREILRIEEDEPPILNLLNTVCYYETWQSYDRKKKIPGVSWRGFSMHFLPHAKYASGIDIGEED